ncbi:MAG TPA: ribonuclease Y [Gemmatimonadales bacterium]|nr:ribonuclease Y [Gemmatimonadales bacterium]
METFLIAALGAAAAGAVFYIVGRAAERRAAFRARETAQEVADRLLQDARKDAEAFHTQLVLSGKEELAKAREAWEQEVSRRREEIARTERRLEDRERSIDRKLEQLERREQDLERKLHSASEREKVVAERQAELERITVEHRRKLEALAGMTAAEARKELLRSVEDEARAEAANLVRNLREQARRDAEREAKKILATVIQRLASETTSETVVSTVPLPNDEMKGRIIGREGRNIRAFEQATGVDVIIDDTPDAVTISCFDPVRREVARLALERLVSDGRIHPARIEEVAKKAQADVEQQIQEAGEQAAYEVGVHGLHPELIKLIGRMKFRSSYGQNLLKHVKEVCWIAGMLAQELGLDAAAARRGALLHDIGKVLTHEHEGSHVQLGVEVARKYGEDPLIINCIEAHHDDVPHQSPISVVVQAADSISGSRPGARREAFETYVKRLTRLEEISNSFTGVEKTYAIQAGREIRVIVTPDKLNDEQAATLSDQIARKIEQELQYPGQIRVVVIRETRAVDYAK